MATFTLNTPADLEAKTQKRKFRSKLTDRQKHVRHVISKHGKIPSSLTLLSNAQKRLKNRGYVWLPDLILRELAQKRLRPPLIVVDKDPETGQFLDGRGGKYPLEFMLVGESFVVATRGQASCAQNTNLTQGASKPKRFSMEKLPRGKYRITRTK